MAGSPCNLRLRPSRSDAMISPRGLFVGRTTLDVLYWLDRLPEEDTKIYARELRMAPGGPALNAAITHALLGGKATLVSAVGGGRWATPVRAELKRHCIDLIRSEERRVGKECRSRW